MKHNVQQYIPNFHLELVKDKDTILPKLDPRNLVESSAALLHQLLDSSPTEQFVVLYIGSDGRIMGSEKIAMGGLESVAVDMQNLFRGALLAHAPRIILSHNHPLGDPKASVQDWMMTDTALMCSELIGVQIVDHIIVSPNGTHYSCWDHKFELEEMLKKNLILKQIQNLYQTVVPSSKNPFGVDLEELKTKFSKQGRNDPF